MVQEKNGSFFNIVQVPRQKVKTRKRYTIMHEDIKRSILNY